MVTNPIQPGAARLDAADPLARFRDRFVGAETDLVYFDGNSLGRPVAAAAERLAAFVRRDWGGRLIRGWDEQWMDLPTTSAGSASAPPRGRRPSVTRRRSGSTS